jgi:hypothetical protein
MNALPSPTAATDPVVVPAGFRCRVCGHADGFVGHRAKEMMFGSHEAFDYALCAGCGCLQIVNVPSDLGRHYGAGYYSYQGPSLAAGFKRRLVAWLQRARSRHLTGGIDPLGWCVAHVKPHTALASLRTLRLARDARILDVGCGGGELLLALQGAGFTQLLGVDPFVSHDLDLGQGLRVLRKSLSQTDGVFDLIMFHHSLEHMPDQGAALGAAFQRLAPVRCGLVCARRAAPFGAALAPKRSTAGASRGLCGAQRA